MVPGIQTHVVQVLRLPIQLLGTEQRGCRRVSPRIQQRLEAPVIRRPRIVMQGPQRADAGINADLIHRTRYSVHEGRRLLHSHQNDPHRFGFRHFRKHIL